MLSSPFDILGALDRLTESIGSFLPQHGGAIGGAVVFAVLVRLGAKALIGAPNGGSAPKESAPDSNKPSDDSDSGKNADGKDERSEDKQKESEKQKEEEERRRAQEQLKELFDMVFEDDGKKEQCECYRLYGWKTLGGR